MTNEQVKLSEDYLRQGLVGLGRSMDHHWNLGHYGAAVIAAYFFCAENQLEQRTVEAVQAQVDKLIAKHNELFIPFPEEEPDLNLLNHVLTALSENIGELHGIGHNIIFATLALRAFNIVPDMLTPSGVEAITSLIRFFTNIDRGGPFPVWEDKQLVTVQTEDQLPPYDSEAIICATALAEVMKFKRIHYGLHQGVVGHLITSAEALIQLARLGYEELARQGHGAHHVYIKLSRTSHDYDFPERDFVLATPCAYDPRTYEYWASDLEREDNWGYGHRLKYVYSFYELMRTLDFPDEMPTYEKQLAYLL